jgi:hypothetical protein
LPVILTILEIAQWRLGAYENQTRTITFWNRFGKRKDTPNEYSYFVSDKC